MRKCRMVTVWLLLVLMELGMVGCKNQDTIQPEPTDNTAKSSAASNCRLPEIPEDYFALLCHNTDVTFTQYSCCNNIHFTVLSAKPISLDDASVSFSGNVPVTYEWYMNPTPEALSRAVFLYYQGIDLVEAERLLAQDQTEEYHKLLDPMQEAYDALSVDDIPTLYTGYLSLHFADFARLSGGTLGTMTVTVNGHTTEYPLDSISYRKAEPIQEDSGELLCDTLALSDVSVVPSQNGQFYFDNINFSATADTAIEKIYFLDAPNSVIDTVSVVQTQGEYSTDVVWDGSQPLPLSKGETVQISVSAHDPIFANTMSANATRYLVIAYRSAEGIGETCVEVTFRMRPNGFWTYAEMEDNLSILPYYESIGNTVER